MPGYQTHSIGIRSFLRSLLLFLSSCWFVSILERETPTLSVGACHAFVVWGYCFVPNSTFIFQIAIWMRDGFLFSNRTFVFKDSSDLTCLGLKSISSLSDMPIILPILNQNIFNLCRSFKSYFKFFSSSSKPEDEQTREQWPADIVASTGLLWTTSTAPFGTNASPKAWAIWTMSFR